MRISTSWMNASTSAADASRPPSPSRRRRAIVIHTWSCVIANQVWKVLGSAQVRM